MLTPILPPGNLQPNMPQMNWGGILSAALGMLFHVLKKLSLLLQVNELTGKHSFSFSLKQTKPNQNNKTWSFY